VYAELVFGLESMGKNQSEMKLKTAEICSYFGLGDIFEKDISELSGGQKQLVSIASVMATAPDILILDEPCGQLDPISASNLISTVVRLNREIGTTVIISEHRLDEILPYADKMLVLNEGRQLAFGNVRECLNMLYNSETDTVLPSYARLFKALGLHGECPCSITEMKDILCKKYGNKIKSIAIPEKKKEKKVVSVKNVYFRYTRNGKDILNNLSFDLYEGEIVCLFGENGSGKSTELGVISGVLKPYSGNVEILGKNIAKYSNDELYGKVITAVPQDVRCIFTENTVREELNGIDSEFDFAELLDTHPYDLSGGEAQLLGIAKAMAKNPRILLLDEPTKGLDYESKQSLIEALKKLSSSDVSVLIVTHDADFASCAADRCGIMFRGEICTLTDTKSFFSGNTYYTTPYSRMTRGLFNNTVTLCDTVYLCEKNGARE